MNATNLWIPGRFLKKWDRFVCADMEWSWQSEKNQFTKSMIEKVSDKILVSVFRITLGKANLQSLL
jgi:hypothetical protein